MEFQWANGGTKQKGVHIKGGIMGHTERKMDMTRFGSQHRGLLEKGLQV